MPSIHDDFKKRDFHMWIHKTHNPHALHRQFPQYTLTSLYRIRAGKPPLYMPDRVYLTLKAIMDHGDHHKREAGRLKFANLSKKYRMPVTTIARYYEEYKTWSNV